MNVFLKFLASVAVWTGIVLVLLSGMSLVLGQGFAEVLGHLPVWGGLALVLSAFPAGITVVDAVFPPRGGIDLRASGAAAVGLVTLVLITFVLVAYAGPAAVRGTASAAPSCGGWHPCTAR